MFRDTSEVRLWQQSNHLVAGEKIWDAARRTDPCFTCAQLFWWYNMYSGADYTVTPRPMYPADGRKIPDVYTQPMPLRDELNAKFGVFPLFNYWGPRADITTSRWIADCTKHIYDTRKPSLTLVYLPHLDYNLQRLGPDDPKLASDLRAIDAICGELIEHAEKDGARVVVLSEYGITAVSGPVHLNRALREAGLIETRSELGRDMLDAGASEAFAMADHQIAHVYVKRRERIAEVKALLERCDGVETVLDEEGKRAHGLDHPRSGELVAISRRRPLVHLLLLARRRPRARLRAHGGHPPQARLRPGRAVHGSGDHVPDAQGRTACSRGGSCSARARCSTSSRLDASLVKGSHGRLTDDPAQGPVFISGDPDRSCPTARWPRPT